VPLNDPAFTSSWLQLTIATDLPASAILKLLTHFGQPQAALAASDREWSQVLGAELSPQRRRLSSSSVEEHCRWLEASHHHLITLADDDYPAALLTTADPPATLFARGQRGVLRHTRYLAMVGSRNATPQGARDAQAFAKAFSDRDVIVVSGMALGIDTAAHEGAIAGAVGATIAVVGTGLDLVYPARNAQLADRIGLDGLIVSEFALGTPPLKVNFPRRNRVISGLVRGVLIVEAAIASGSLITARFAAEQGREVFAIPGSIHAACSKGCHALIKDGAKLVEEAADVLAELQWDTPPIVSPAPQPRVATALPSELAALFASMGTEPIAVESIAQRTGLTIHTLLAQLTHLEMLGRVARLSSGLMQRLS
jgi:DNA processing protein